MKQQLFEQIRHKKSFLCVGLDTDITKIPAELLKKDDPIFEFNKQIIDATHELAVAYKINTAFYESTGAAGWASMQKTVEYIPKDIFTIADAKRGDIGNTANMYAKAFFEDMNFDSVTLSPYMGADAVSPFLDYKGKTAIILGLTSNAGSQDFQMLKTGDQYLYERVIKTAASWGNPDNTMFVVGATHPEMFKGIRNIIPDNFLLVPGVGAQGGDLGKVCEYGLNSTCGLLINSSRGIIYAGKKTSDFSIKAMKAAFQLQRQMESELISAKLL